MMQTSKFADIHGLSLSDRCQIGLTKLISGAIREAQNNLTDLPKEDRRLH